MGREIDQRVVRRAWERFVERGDVSESLRSDVIASWKRSAEFQVSIESDAAPLVAERDVFQHRSIHNLLSKCARPVFDRASKFLDESISMMILTDAEGLIIETMGDDRAVGAGREIHLEHGGKWSEADIGTNAIGTAVAMARPVQINGAEHFCTKVQCWTCAAAPICHPSDGEILGVVDISGPAKYFSPQSLALAMVMSEYIQTLMAGSCEQDRQSLLEYFGSKRANWPNEEVLVIDRRGIIVHASDNAVNIAKMADAGALQGNSLPILKHLPFEQWQARLQEILPGANADIVSTADCELGALVVLPGQGRSSTGSKVAAQKAKRTVLPSLEEIEPKSARFVAKDPTVAAIVKQVELAAPRRLPILIRGATGTGKEQLARHAHFASGRKGSFVALNCAAMPESLIEAELFGYAEGAFTGARKGGSRGLVRDADHGTLFLDEIGDMPISLQPVLLRFLDDWTARPIGGDNYTVDILLVSATNARLDESIANGRFRSDLLYRLNALDVSLPSLNDRGDFAAIARHVLARIDPKLKISEESIACLATQPWPGNIRELRNVLARLSLSTTGNEVYFSAPEGASPLTGRPASDNRLWNQQRARIWTMFEELDGNVSETARRLGVSRNTVYRALKKSCDR